MYFFQPLRLTEPPEIVGDDYVKEKLATYVTHIVEYA